MQESSDSEETTTSNTFATTRKGANNRIITSSSSNSSTGGVSLSRVTEVWKEIDLEGKRSLLDAQAAEITDNKDARLLSRKKLAEQTKSTLVDRVFDLLYTRFSKANG
jgi:hypothetical protein